MGPVLGELLPLAVGVAVSPVPIIAVILMLLAPKAGGASAGFLLGWVAGIAVACGVFLVLAGSLDLGTGDEPSTTASWVKLLLGVLVLLVGVRQWRSRPKGDAEPSMPKWMTAIDSFTAAKATGLGFLLSAVNPKNLLMCAAAGASIDAGTLSGGEDTVAVLAFTVVAASTVAVPVLAYALARDRMAAPLNDLKIWLTANNVVVMAVLLLVIGSVLLGKGLGGLL